MQPEMLTKYLPRDRRDLQQYMVDQSQSNFFVICVRLKLFQEKNIDRHLMGNFARRLFKLVKHRHTHLWDKNGYSSSPEHLAPADCSQAGEVERSPTI